MSYTYLLKKVLKAIKILKKTIFIVRLFSVNLNPQVHLGPPFLETVDWMPLFKLAYNVTVETYFKAFQFKIVRRTLNCKYNMFNLKKAETPVYSYFETEVVDSSEHHLFYCNKSRKFWTKIEQWITENLGLQFKFTVCKILLGIIFYY